MELTSNLEVKCTSLLPMYKRDHRMYVAAVAVTVRAQLVPTRAL